MKNLLENLKHKQLEDTMRSKEYKQLLKELALKIRTSSKQSKNEATTVSGFEINLFSFINSVFNLNYYPEKEVGIETVRHVSKGRMDSKIGSLIIEFKHFSKLSTKIQQDKASLQLTEYLNGILKTKKTENLLGIITDGINIKFIRVTDGVLKPEVLKKIDENDLDRIIKSIILLDKIALTPKNLLEDFTTDKNEEISISKKCAKTLYNSLKNQVTDKSIMLFEEWKELFRLAHDDKTKQKSIEERKISLEKALDIKLSSKEEEYLALFALQTTYAIIVKIIAFKVISKIHFKQSLISFENFATSNFEVLKMEMQNLEDGEIFRDLGIVNLLEGDFFSWYCTEEQWDESIGEKIQEIFKILSKYEDKALFNVDDKIQDLFNDLYLQIIPDKVRHSLGEFYTPHWLAEHLVNNVLKKKKKENWKGLDPCAGSGTFITVMISKIIEDNPSLNKKELFFNILNRVKAIDLNPLAVLTARVNYFINIAHLIEDGEDFEIPVYLGDSSYVPEKVEIESIKCLKYKIKTLKGEIDIEIPESALNDLTKFSKTMIDIEFSIKAFDEETVFEKLISLIDTKDINKTVQEKIRNLSDKLIDLEKNDWNGIWTRIITNFLTTASLGKFDFIVGNPPWVDWKNLPSGYRERIKDICIERHLFSGDKRTGGINLNICALISNVAANKWLADDGILSFLMPKSLIHQQSYEGFRKFNLSDGKRLYLQEIIDWTKSGNPFKPVTEKFLTYVFNREKKDYKNGIDVFNIKIKRGKTLTKAKHVNSFEEIEDWFEISKKFAGQLNPNNTVFSYGTSRDELKKFSIIMGNNDYKGREGIEFYPQELYLLEPKLDMKAPKNKMLFENFQNGKSKYKIPKQTILLETDFLFPLLKGTNIERFNLTQSDFIVPFPYERHMKIPKDLKTLSKESPLLSKYLLKHKNVITSQTEYNEKIINNSKAEFYALARVGKYSYADYSVVYRDNSKWQASVVKKVMTPWGEEKMPLFQNHAVSISQDIEGRFINENEAYYICGILNTKVVKDFIMNSSDSRSFKINIPVKIPKFDENNKNHKIIFTLSKECHLKYSDEIFINEALEKIENCYLEICKD